jgi:ABC-type amino acid transport substrate-binding protein
MASFNQSGVVVAIVSGSTGETAAINQLQAATKITVDDPEVAFQLVLNSTAHGYLYGKTTVQYRIKVYNDATAVGSRVAFSTVVDADTPLPITVIMNTDKQTSAAPSTQFLMAFIVAILVTLML